MNRLKGRRERFAIEYLKDFCATQAAIRAGYSSKTAKQIGSRLLTFIDVKQRVEDLKHEHYMALHMSTNELLAQVARIARFDPRKLVDANGNPLPVQELDDDTAMALVAVDLVDTSAARRNSERKGATVTQTRKFRAADKGKALEMLGRHAGLFEQDHQNQCMSAADAFSATLAKIISLRIGVAGMVTKVEPEANSGR